jgi:hypothetical protein
MLAVVIGVLALAPLRCATRLLAALASYASPDGAAPLERPD